MVLVLVLVMFVDRIEQMNNVVKVDDVFGMMVMLIIISLILKKNKNRMNILFFLVTMTLFSF
jgi:hypothetical protein